MIILLLHYAHLGVKIIHSFLILSIIFSIIQLEIVIKNEEITDGYQEI